MPFYLPGYTRHKRIVRNFHSLNNHTGRCNNTETADFSIMENSGIHADKDIVPDTAAI